MASKSSIVPDIIWIWVIEALATYEQADASTLIGLVKMAPAISGELGKDAKEALSLRILESLFPQSDEAVVDADADGGQNGKISFDSSECCEDVLQQILRETPENSARFEKEKWDVGSFLTHKRSSLPKCALKKLKEALLESSHPLLASLKEKSKLVIPNASENTSPVNDENLDVQDTVAKDDTTILNPRKDKDKLQEKELQKADQQQQLHFNDENLCQDTHGKRTSADSMENLEPFVKSKDNNCVEPNALDEDEHLSKDKNSMEHDGDQADSLLNLCVKCNEGGELLVCSSDSCPLHVHESCLGFDVAFDEDINFFCPFCTYSQAISKYQEAKRKASQARNDLQAFSSFKVKKGGSNESFKKQSEFEKDENRQQTGAFGETSAGNVANQSMTEGEGQKKVKVNGNVNESDLIIGSRHVDKHIPQPSTPKRKCKEKESQRSIIESSCSRELRKRKAQYTPPAAIPLLRRKTIPWTKSEEETLKEGVERYSSVNDKKIPWKEILDFGHKVFHKGRTPIDLKDKWRNICKATK